MLRTASPVYCPADWISSSTGDSPSTAEKRCWECQSEWENNKCFIALSYPTEGHSLASTSSLRLYRWPVWCVPVLHQITGVSITQPQPRLTFGHKMILVTVSFSETDNLTDWDENPSSSGTGMMKIVLCVIMIVDSAICKLIIYNWVSVLCKYLTWMEQNLTLISRKRTSNVYVYMKQLLLKNFLYR